MICNPRDAVGLLKRAGCSDCLHQWGPPYIVLVKTRPQQAGSLTSSVGALCQVVYLNDRFETNQQQVETTTILAPTVPVQVLENSKTWLSIIICSLMLWIDLWCFFKISVGVENIGIPLNKGRVSFAQYSISLR